LTKKGNKFFIGDKKVIPVEDHLEFLKGFYDNPEIGFLKGAIECLPK
jgi:hypothetical protein